MTLKGVPLLKNILLAVVSTSVALLVIEGALRITAAVPTHTLERVLPEQWDTIPGPLMPGQSFTDSFLVGVPFRISVNNLGFRGPDQPLVKREGTYRILCLGDSYTIGTGVDDAETYPFLLEADLRQRMPARPVEVINAGIGGFTIVDELAFLEEKGLDLDPDLVVLGFVLNDLADLTREKATREVMRLAVEENGREILGPLKMHLRQTATYNALFMVKAYLRTLTGRDQTIPNVDPRHLVNPPYDRITLALFDEYRDRLAEMKRVLDDRSIPLVLLIFPFWEQVSRNATDEAQRRIAEIGASLQVPVVDLLPAFRREDPGGLTFFHMPRDDHPSSRGYRCAAGVLADALEPMIASR